MNVTPAGATPGPISLSAPGMDGSSPAHASPARERLHKVCDEMEAAFLRQMFQVMRASADGEDGPEESTGGDTFTAMFDDHLASVAAGKEENGLAEALYRQMVKRLPMEVVNGND